MRKTISFSHVYLIPCVWKTAPVGRTFGSAV
jgi:hypothetical protein